MDWIVYLLVPEVLLSRLLDKRGCENGTYGVLIKALNNPDNNTFPLIGFGYHAPLEKSDGVINEPSKSTLLWTMAHLSHFCRPNRSDKKSCWRTRTLSTKGSSSFATHLPHRCTIAYSIKVSCPRSSKYCFRFSQR